MNNSHPQILKCKIIPKLSTIQTIASETTTWAESPRPLTTLQAQLGPHYLRRKLHSQHLQLWQIQEISKKSTYLHPRADHVNDEAWMKSRRDVRTAITASTNGDASFHPISLFPYSIKEKNVRREGRVFYEILVTLVTFFPQCLCSS